MPFLSYAQNFEDIALWRALRTVTDGFWIDVGAHDPDHHSVTRALSERGWRGINIEPVPERLARFAARRPRDINLCIATGAEPGDAVLHDVEGTPLSTLDTARAEHIRAEGHPVRHRATAVSTLAAICAEHAPPAIHVLKIDCNGSEHATLRGADLAQHRPWIILVDAVEPGSGTPDHADWEPLLLGAGYVFAWFDGLNRFYVAHEHADRLVPALARPPSVFDDFVRAADPAPSPPAVPDATDPLIAAAAVPVPPEARLALALRCRDCDDIPRVADAGQRRVLPDGEDVQIMHNGLRLPADPAVSELAARLHGHLAPQQERLFHAAVEALPPDATLIEVGGSRAYHAAWFLHAAPARRALVLEPDPNRRATAQRTMRLNGLDALIVAGHAGAAPAPAAPFGTLTAGDLLLPGFDVPALMQAGGFDRVDLLDIDAHGAELAALQGCAALFRAGRVGLVFVATHPHPVSHDPLTHHRCLSLLRDAGGTIEAEFDAYESFDGDGLIVARFGPAPAGWRLPAISRVRPAESLHREPVFDLAAVAAQAAAQTGASEHALARQAAADLYEHLLFRPIEADAVDSFEHLITGEHGFAGALQAVLNSEEFRLRRPEFAATYFGCSPAAEVAAGVSIDPVAGFFADHAPPGAILLDIGAHAGRSTRNLLHALPGLAVLHAFEPEPDNAALLRQALAGPAIHIHPVGLGAAAGRVPFYKDADDSTRHSIHRDASDARPVEESAATLLAVADWMDQDLVGEEPILLRSDAQGADEDIIAAIPWRVWRRIGAAVVAMSPTRRGVPLPPGFIARIADMPNRLLHGRSATVEEIETYGAVSDASKADLYLWR